MTPSPKVKGTTKYITPKHYIKPNNIVCVEEWFTLKKFQLKKAPQIDDSKLPRNVRRVMEKMNEDNFI